MIRLHNIFLRFKPYHLLIEWTKILILPGFSPLPLYTVATFFFQEIGKDELINKASSLSYNFMLAIFPAIIFLFTLIPYVPIDNFQNQLLTLIALILPAEAYIAVRSTLVDIVSNQNSKLLSFGFLLALIFSTNGVHTLMEAFNKSSLISETRSWFKQRLVALYLTVLISFALILGLIIMTIGEYVFNALKSELLFKDSFWIYVINMVRWFILIVIYFVTISLLYRYGPANAKKWKFFSAGSWMATILAVLTFWGFSFYINNFSNYNKLYGSIGTLIVLMIWLYLNSLIILVGFELNASIDLSKRSIKIIKPKFNSFKSPPAAENPPGLP
ncbi:YihY/virulence factor BrkB family protein [Daejeonella sp. H1SJ63]|uniref:YihY/virulence factor BrkB family protein n=1 Tax=Daejeonella sp. H1SJ63 TaxID=3034145 RepID=UPI0023EE280F|nr:YihY/virulence factor BrkB family protein [Daejeonella sp. H1SJ63]